MGATPRGWQTQLMTTAASVHLSDAQWQILFDARAAYGEAVSVHYDDVLHEVSARTMSSGSVGKVDIGALLFWKRLRADTPWASQLNVMADADVRVHTGRAMDLVNDTSLSLSDAAGRGRGLCPGYRASSLATRWPLRCCSRWPRPGWPSMTGALTPRFARWTSRFPVVPDATCRSWTRCCRLDRPLGQPSRLQCDRTRE